MPEEPVYFKAGDIRLQGMLQLTSSAAPAPAAVICHPHPMYGGAMDNNVVMAIARALQQTGHATLRFNFRGVGRSEGSYADGAGEIDDVRAALDFMREQAVGAQPSLVLAGYSFGAWVCAHALVAGDSVSRLILVAPPTAMFDFSGLAADTAERARHFVAGDRDQFCDRDALQALFERLPEPKSMSVVPGADHFFFGLERPVIEAVKKALSDHP